MNLDRNTYEAWLLDRLEGNLSPDQERRLDAFLVAHPDLAAGPGELPQVSAPETGFGAKELLKRTYPPKGTPDTERLDDFLVGKAEGDLDPSTLQALEKYLFEHPEAARDARLIAFSKVMPEERTFTDKATIIRHFPPQGLPDAHRLLDFLIAALENDLTPEQSTALDHYLSAHPEVAREVRAVQATRLKAEVLRFRDRGTLERHFPPQGLPDAHRLVDFLIAALENDLATDQRRALERWVTEHPEAQRAQRLIDLTRVQAPAIVYANKEGLKKREVRVIPLWTRLAAAAGIVAVIGLGWWLMRNDTQGIDHGIAGTVKEDPAPPVPQQQTSPTIAPEGTVPAPVKSSTESDAQQGAPGKVPSANGPKTAPAPQRVAPQPAAPMHVPQQQPPAVAPSTQPLEEAVSEPLMAEVPPTPAPEGAQPRPRTAPMEAGGSYTLGTLVANTVREGVLETSERPTDLDRNDAVALVDKGLGAITGGHGGMQVQRTGKRERVQLRLGRNLAISASRGR
ncbi:MAG TPA: hypothetical protein VGE21_03330 [Flavobacteriales bacterium]